MNEHKSTVYVCVHTLFFVFPSLYVTTILFYMLAKGIEHLIYVHAYETEYAVYNRIRVDFNQKLCVVHVHDLCVNF